MKRILLVLVLGSVPGGAQDPSMSLNDAVRLALEKNKSIEASGAASKAAEMRVSEARSGRLPKLNYSESWTRSDNPVFVFGSLLTQHQFGTQNFEIGPLNNPDFLNNFQTQLTADQTLYDAGQTKHAVRSAELTKDISSEEGRRTQMQVIAAVVRAYYDSLLSADQLRVTSQAIRSAEADLERAQAIRSAGMSTDVDTLSIRAHLAAVREQQIRRQADVDVAQAALNDAIGLALDTPHTLTSPLIPLESSAGSLADQANNAVAERPEARQARLATSLAETQAARARSSLLPQVTVHAAYEADRQRFVTRGGDNWLVSVGLRWNLFNGFGDKATIDESKFVLQRSSADEARTSSTIRLQVHRAYADLHAATQRIGVAQASVAEAEESLRITQNRYEAGISNVTDLLRTETTVLEARTRQLAAVRDQRIAAAMLELAAGTLTPGSAVLNERTR
ncbi:MAG TPA: TolC family protein [Bryobacteraceae bacterium]|nr:TolC family protein [Bryobacteraceae bacterium]